MKVSKNLPLLIAALTLGIQFASAQDEAKPETSKPEGEKPQTEKAEKPAEGGPRAANLDRFFNNLDADKDGKVSKEEYINHAKGEAENRFSKVDANSDGSIDKGEFENAIGKQREARPRGERGDGFRRPDAPRDGDKPRGERGDGFRRPDGPRDGDRPRGERGEGDEARGRRPEGGFRGGNRLQEMDKDGDGFISKEEYQAASEQQFKNMDQDGDGKFSLEELRSRFGGGREGRPNRERSE